MRYILSIIVCLSGLAALIWLLHLGPTIVQVIDQADIFKPLLIIFLYLLSHVLRMVRLANLTLDQRRKIPELLLAHIIASFPAAVIPLKIGEFFRIGAFYIVFDGHQKALAIWLIERIGDVLTLILFISLLGAVGVEIPQTVRNVFIVFSAVSILALLGLYSLSHTFVFLNRYLVLTSSSDRGLRLLKLSYVFKQFELTIRDCLKGRVAAFWLSSALIWIFEILAYSCFMSQISDRDMLSDSSFAFGLFGSLSNQVNGAGQGFGFFQSFSLACLTLCGTIIFLVFNFLKLGKQPR